MILGVKPSLSFLQFDLLPFLDSDKVEGHLSVGEGLLIEIAAVASDKRGHVVA